MSDVLARVEADLPRLQAKARDFEAEADGCVRGIQDHVRALLRKRKHQVVEEECLKAEQTLDNVDLTDLPEREALRTRRKKVLGQLDGIARQVHGQTARLQQCAELVSIDTRAAAEATEVHPSGAAPWQDPQVIRRVYEAALR